MSENKFILRKHDLRPGHDYSEEVIDVSGGDGHGGGDNGIMGTFGRLVADEYEGVSASSIEVSCQNHMIVFAAEEAREKGTVVSVPEFAARYGM